MQQPQFGSLQIITPIVDHYTANLVAEVDRTPDSQRSSCFLVGEAGLYNNRSLGEDDGNH